jgi:GST-like protein
MTIQLHTWGTPNGRKISIMLEEVGLPYEVKPVDIGKDEQFAPAFLAISPNNKIPAIVDPDGPEGRPVSIFESGAILIWLAEKTGRLMPGPARPRERIAVIEWLMMQMGSVGPMLGQTHHFVRFNKGKAPYAEERYLAENRRIYGVLDRRLERVPYLAGDYSIADVATFPWIARFEYQTMDLHGFPSLLRWYRDIAARPAVQRGYDVPATGAGVPVP